MPELRQIHCAIDVGPSNIRLPEYRVTYHDRKVEAYVPVPDTDQAFSIHVRTRGYIAPGLAVFVFIDGQYQCNRNQFGIREPADDADDSACKVDFRLRQKEEQTQADRFIGREWTFQSLNFDKSISSATRSERRLTLASDRKADNVDADIRHFETNVGKIEVLVLRCKMSTDNPGGDTRISGYEPQEHGKGDAHYETHALSPSRCPANKPALRREQSGVASPIPPDSAVGGFFGLFDGPADMPEFYKWDHSPDNYMTRRDAAPYPIRTTSAWEAQRPATAFRPDHSVVNIYPSRATLRNDAAYRESADPIPMPNVHEYHPRSLERGNSFSEPFRRPPSPQALGILAGHSGTMYPEEHRAWYMGDVRRSNQHHISGTRPSFQHEFDLRSMPESYFRTQGGPAPQHVHHSRSGLGFNRHETIGKHELKFLEQRLRYLGMEKEQLQRRVAGVKKALAEHQYEHEGCKSVVDVLALQEVLEEQESTTNQQLDLLTTRLKVAGIDVDDLRTATKSSNQASSPKGETTQAAQAWKQTPSPKGDTTQAAQAWNQTSSPKGNTTPAAQAWKAESRPNAPTSPKKSETPTRAASPARTTSGDDQWGSQTKEQEGGAQDSGQWNTCGQDDQSKDQSGQGTGWGEEDRKDNDDTADKGAKSSHGEDQKGTTPKASREAQAQSDESKPYWGDWQRVTHRVRSDIMERAGRPVYCSPAESLPTVHDRVQSQGITHGVQAGPGAEYCHRAQRPKYIDSMSTPYAVFTFHYRDRATLEGMLGGCALEEFSGITAEIEMQSLRTKPRDWLIQQLCVARKAARPCEGSQHSVEAKSSAKSNQGGNFRDPVEPGRNQPSDDWNGGEQQDWNQNASPRGDVQW